jgi:hypothetical protein
MSSKNSERAVDAVKNSAPPAADAVNPGQIKCIMLGIVLILLMNLALTVTGVVLGLQVKTEVEGIEQELAPIMEFAEKLEASGLMDSASGLSSGMGGAGDGGGDMPPLPGDN